MKKILKGGGVLLLIVCCYYLFEPIMVWGIGWRSLPEVYKTDGNVAVQDSSFLQAIGEGQQILTGMHATLQAPAVSVAIGFKNRIVWAEAQGYSDLDKNILASTETAFRIGSVSKAVTSVALGKLLEQGIVRLDNSVGQYVSYFDSPQITIRQLASHMSGIRNYGTCFCFPIWEYYNNDSYTSVEKSVAVFKGDALLFEPGTMFEYSSYNYTLLSGVMEEASGKDFLSLMASEVFEPLAMTHTFGDYADIVVKNRATFYEVRDSDYKKAFPVDNSNKWAGGGIVSTPSDLVKLGNALLSGTILQKETVETLFTAQKLSDGTINSQQYALGWRHQTFDLFDGKKKVQVVHHGGKATGATSLLILFPEYQLSIALMINKSTESFPMFDYVLPIAEHFIRQIEDENKI